MTKAGLLVGCAILGVSCMAPDRQRTDQVSDLGDGGPGNDVGSLPTCGNNIREAGEVCDGTDVGMANCTTEVGKGADGTVTCTEDCSALLTTNCQWCGDGIRNGSETCDGTDLGEAACPGGSTGPVACSPFCELDKSGCSVPATCGDNKKDDGEECDGEDVGSSTCGDVIPTSYGVLGCAANCTFDASSCSYCGDGKKNGSEQCDGDDVGTATCATVSGDPQQLGFLLCDTSCSFDTSACYSRVTISNVDDAAVLELIPAVPQGGGNALWVFGKTADHRSTLIRPRDVASYVPQNATVLHADLCVHPTDYGGYTEIYRVGASWSEETVTWNTLPGIAPGPLVVFFIDSSVSCVGITGQFQNWVNGDPAYGLLLVSGGGPDISTLYSHETGYGPYFDVSFF